MEDVEREIAFHYKFVAASSSPATIPLRHVRRRRQPLGLLMTLWKLPAHQKRACNYIATHIHGKTSLYVVGGQNVSENYIAHLLHRSERREGGNVGGGVEMSQQQFIRR